MRRPLLATALVFLATCAHAANVGFVLRTIPNGADAPLTIGIWYPTAATPHPTQISLFNQNVAEGAPPITPNLALVVISHGNGGQFAGHCDTAYALAQAGFIAAAPTHTGDNYRDQSRATAIGGRVRELSATITYLERSWRPQAVNPERVGAFGFSAGGLTVLLAAGAKPDLGRITSHCEASPSFSECRLLAAHPPAKEQPASPDPRLRAIAVAAPALGYTLNLAAVHVPVQLWRADNDTVLPAPFYADAVRAKLPTPPDFHRVPNAGHFDFLAPCPPALARVAPPICASAAGFDRVAFHRAFDWEIVDFFKKNLK